MDRIHQSTSAYKNKEITSDKSDIQSFNLIKRQNSPNRVEDNLKQELKKIEKTLEYLKTRKMEIDEKIKNHLSTNKNLEIIYNRSKELKKSKNDNANNKLLKGKELENLTHEREKLVHEKNILEQSKIDVEQRIYTLQSLEEKLNGLEKVIQKFLHHRRVDASKSTISVIQVLNESNAEIGFDQKDNSKLDSIEYALNHLKEVDEFLKRYRTNEVPQITDVLQFAKDQQASFDQKVGYTTSTSSESGPSESSANPLGSLESHPFRLITHDDLKHKDSNSITNEKEYFDKKVKLSNMISNLKMLKITRQEKLQNKDGIHKEMAKLSQDKLNQIFETYHGVLKDLADQMYSIEKVQLYELHKKHPESEYIIIKSNDIYKEQIKEFEALYRKLKGYNLYIKPNEKKQEWEQKISESIHKVINLKTMKRMVFNKLDNNDFYDNTNLQKMSEDMKNKFEMTKNKIKELPHDYYSAIQELYESYKNVVKTELEYSEILQEITKYHSKKCKNVSKSIIEMLPTTHQQKLQAICEKIQKNTEQLQSIQKELKENKQAIDCININIGKSREDIEIFAKGYKAIEKEIKSANERYKVMSLTLSKEVKNDLKLEIKNGKEIQTAKEEKNKIQEQLKNLGQAQQPTEGEPSFIDQVIQGALKNVHELKSFTELIDFTGDQSLIIVKEEKNKIQEQSKNIEQAQQPTEGEPSSIDQMIQEKPTSIKELKSLRELINFTEEKSLIEMMSGIELKSLTERKG
jgi:predicted  nucleic acid-binding Zn-ribbon protein